MVSGLGGDGEGNYGDGLAMAAKMVMNEAEAVLEHVGDEAYQV